MLHASLLYQNVGGEEEDNQHALLLTVNGHHGGNGLLARIHVAPKAPKQGVAPMQLKIRAVVLPALVLLQNPDHAIQECKELFRLCIVRFKFSTLLINSY